MGNDHIISGIKPGKPFTANGKVWRRIRRRAELPDVRLHDLRHSFASIGVLGHMGLPVIGAILGHNSVVTEVERLAAIYVKDGIIPSKYLFDALHIATATINDLDYVFSLNFKHINKIKTKVMTNNVNIREGYKPIIIASPMEVIEDENTTLLSRILTAFDYNYMRKQSI